ncbi:hypothetical protein REC12_13575 [Desulfosporosinus sp. PR]|uniref:hypothetical protein n=1 Tax=Candidatus Desulfosporosinus nitrosoreducens TaxID=3401928 RepID=UPI0027EF74B2|nr:hypothetical protein [Desulfosporosinus sp. PR]MDQ7094621.1 hypothetical protein [Desulfosporosinus sp. PR]
MANVPRPSCNEVENYLVFWSSLENYLLQERALTKLFSRTYPANTDINDVLIKVSTLNAFYSTNVYFPLQIAQHILDLKIDERLQADDMTLVNDIAKVTIDNGSVKNFYSFATKYCSQHKPLAFPIYDSYVDRMLRYFRDQDGFSDFSNYDLKDYAAFKEILLKFRAFYNLERYNLQEIDRYLWLSGKEKFSKISTAQLKHAGDSVSIGLKD